MNRVAETVLFPLLGVVLAILIFVPPWGHGERLFSFPREEGSPGAEEWVLVYLGSSSCFWSSQESTRSLVREIAVAVGEEARTRGLGFSTIGVARDVDPQAGLVHLATIGAFDEVLSGGGASNLGWVRFVYDQHRGEASTPQLLLLRRFRADNGSWADDRREEVMVRRIGVSRIESWLRESLFVPQESN
jgi:hypothetical protein